MVRRARGLVLVLLVGGCFSDDPASVPRETFPAVFAQATCDWLYGCCDAAERTSYPGGTQDAAACTQQLSQSYATLFKDAKPELWRGEEAAALVDEVKAAASSCPRAFDPAAELAERELVTPTKQPGDGCQNSWDCTTKFCKNTVCANPLAAGSSCVSGDPCQAGLRCINGTCRELQPDGAQCQTGQECISGACGGGKCGVFKTYTCDKQ